MSSIHILTETRRIENIGNRIFKVLTPQMNQKCQDGQLMLQEHENKLTCGRTDIIIIYPEIYDEAALNEAGYVIIPEFLIPGRPYPIYIYLFSIVTYCLNPLMGQREAAKRTRERFGLKTFSHTTLGRAMKKLEKLINENEGEAQETTQPIKVEDVDAGSFPTVEQTIERKLKVASYLTKASAGDRTLEQEARQVRIQPDYRRPPYAGAFIDACHNIVGYTFLKYHRLLL